MDREILEVYLSGVVCLVGLIMLRGVLFGGRGRVGAKRRYRYNSGYTLFGEQDSSFDLTRDPLYDNLRMPSMAERDRRNDLTRPLMRHLDATSIFAKNILDDWSKPMEGQTMNLFELDKQDDKFRW